MQTKKTIISMAIFSIVFILAATFDLSTNATTQEQSNETYVKASLLSENTDVVTPTTELANINEIVSFEAENENETTDPIEIEERLAENGNLISYDDFIELNDLESKTNSDEDADNSLEDATKDTENIDEAEDVAHYSNIGISIANDYVNIRKSPNTDGELLGKLYRNSAATILETEGEWYYVESGSVVGYIKSEYLKTGLSDEEIAPYGIQKIRVNTDGLNVRKEPSQESERIACIYLGENYPSIEVLDDWVKVNIEDENVIGYVSKEYVDITIKFTTAISKKEEEEKARIEAEKRAAKETSVVYRDSVSYSEDDLKLLAALVHAEAGDQCYEGKLAVANVVLNRVKSSKYPNSISKVIYQSGQFTVASSGSLAKQLANYSNYNSQSQKLTIKAAKAALEGANNIGSRLYFNAYKTAVKKGYNKKSTSVKIEDHLFW